MKTTIKFNTYNKDVKRKSTITIELKENSKGKEVFSVVASMRGCYGQCLDDIKKYNNSPLFNEIYRLWKLYHLNDMNAGTEKQTEEIEKWLSEGNKYDYDNICNYLKSIDLYEDNGYRYGSAWLYRAIPENDLKIIKEIILKYGYYSEI